MNDNFIHFMTQAVLIGGIATVVMDVWALFQKHVLKQAGLDYALVGRWALLMPTGRFYHNHIMKTEPVRGEVAVGWLLHYGIGIVFAAAHLAYFGEQWLASPTLFPALLTGWITLAMPFLVMQPAFGFGFFASRTPAPWWVRVKSIAAHTSFGIGIYFAGFGGQWLF